MKKLICLSLALLILGFSLPAISATKYYFHDTEFVGGPSDEQTSWTADVNASGYDTARNMTTTAGSSQVETSTSFPLWDNYGYYRVFCSPELGAQTVQAQTLTLAVGTKASIGFHFYFGWGVYVLRSGSNVATILANQTDGDTIDSSEEGRVDTGTSTEQTLSAQDRICVELWVYVDDSVGYIGYLYYDGATDPTNQTSTSDAGSYINFATDTICEYGECAGGQLRPPIFFLGIEKPFYLALLPWEY